MNLKADSLLVRWAYFFSLKHNRPDSYWGPETTTLCAFFWRAFFFVPLAWLVILSAVGTLFYALYMKPVEVLSSIGIILFAVIGGIGLAYLNEYLKEKKIIRRMKPRPTEPSTLQVFLEGAKSIKRKFCPIIHFTDPNT